MGGDKTTYDREDKIKSASVDSPAKSTTLIIRKTGDERYDFWIETMGTATTSYHNKIAQETLENIKESLNEVVESINGLTTSDYSSFESWGKMLYRSLLPEPIQDRIKNLKTPLLISTDDPTLPWELLHDGDNFISLHLSIGRKLITQFEVGYRPQPSKEKLSFLIIANPTSNLEGADKEAAILSNFLSKNNFLAFPPKVISRDRATFNKVIEHLSSGEHDVVHYSGHGEFNEEGQSSYLELAHGKKLLPDNIMKNIQGYPIVFLNACHSGKIGKVEESIYSGFRHVENLATGFIIGNKNGGAIAFVGTLWKISDSVASQFSISFYQSLFKGKTIGESLKEAKILVRKSTNDISWAAFILYGDPAMKVIKTEETAVKPEPWPPRKKDKINKDKINLEPLGDSARLVLYYAHQEMMNMKLSILITSHLFIALTKIENGYTQDFFKGEGIKPKDVRDTIRSIFADEIPDLESENIQAQDKIGISKRLWNILNLSKTYAKINNSPLIEEKHLFQAFLEDGEGITVEILKHLNIKMPKNDRKTILSMALSTKEDAPKQRSDGPEPPPPPSQSFTWEDFDKPAKSAISITCNEAIYMRHRSITTPHLFIGLTKVEGGITQDILQYFKVGPKKIRDNFRYSLGIGNALPGKKPFFTKRLYDILSGAKNKAEKDRQQLIEEKHLLWAVLKDGVKDEKSITIQILKGYGLDTLKMLELIESGKDIKIEKKKLTPILDDLGRDLTKLAEENKLSPLIGREDEIGRLIQTLSRKTKNNPVLIGKAGVGKTVIVEGLAKWIIAGKVPSEFQAIRIIEITATSLVAGTKYRGDFEERLQKIIEEARQSENIILFMDEIHTLMGAGDTRNGTLDAANILKPALARGEIRCIGATTIAEYQRHIERDAALERRFQPVMVSEPSYSECLDMLRGTKTNFESHHNVIIQDDALEAAVDLSIKHLTDRQLPDKAFDLIDEACAWVRLKKTEKSKENKEEKGKYKVRPENIAEIVAKWKNIPVGELKGEKREQILNLENKLKKKIIGQDKAVSVVSEAIRLARSGLKEPGKPIGVFLFAGPTGVGKTALAKVLAEILFGSEDKLIRLDMSEFAEKHTMSKLIGAPPGYIGYGEEGQLTGKLRTYPYSVVLLDEIDKAHPDIFDVFIQLFDEGRLTDGKGYTVNAKNAIFIMTSNIGADLVYSNRQKNIGFADSQAVESAEERLQGLLEKTFSHEFINRIDEVVIFNKLSDENIKDIVNIMLKDLEDRVGLKYGITMYVDKNVIDLLCEKGYTKLYGARPMKRTIEKLIAKPISWLILKENLGQSSKNVYIKVKEGKVIVSKSSL